MDVFDDQPIVAGEDHPGGSENRGVASFATRLSEWNRSDAEFPRACVHQLFEAQAARTPDAVAVVHADEQLTYRQLNERANQLARHIRMRGVRPNSLVGIGLRRSPLMMIALLGVWKAGAAYVPLDPSYPTERLAFMVADAGLPLVLIEETTLPIFQGADRATNKDVYLRIDGLTGGERVDDPACETGPDDLAYVIYTSGSTGTPKGVMVTHGGLTNYVCWAVTEYDIAAGTSVPVHSSLSFDLTVTSLYPPLVAGAQIELLPEDMAAQSLLAALRARKRRIVKITPAHLDLLNQQLAPAEMAGLADALVIGGEDLKAECLAPWRKHAPGVRLINEYGPTETVVGCSIYEVQPGDPTTGSIPIGKPIANTRLHVLDKNRRPVMPGVVGELYIGGAGIARGYLNRPDLTRERFLSDPFSDKPGARLYKTGDLARLRETGDGIVLEYLGRQDEQIKVDGYRIEPGEIELALMSHPEVRTGTVIASEAVPGEKQLIAYVVPRDATDIPSGALRAFLARRLPRFMLPHHIVCLDALPLTPNGKIDRSALQRMAPSKIVACREAGEDEAASELGARTPTEKLVMDAFREIFRRADIGLANDFFDMGGRSLMAMRLMGQLRSAVGLNLPQRMLYEHPTVAGLAAAIDAFSWSAIPAMNAMDGERVQFSF
jgi:amino acid adenylation domain-containing protein